MSAGDSRNTQAIRDIVKLFEIHRAGVSSLEATALLAAIVACRAQLSLEQFVMICTVAMPNVDEAVWRVAWTQASVNE